MTEEEKRLITQEKHPGCVAKGHKLAALMEKRKDEILRNKEQSPVQSSVEFTEQSSVQSTVQSTIQSTVQPTVQSTLQSNYVYGVGILAVVAIGVCVFFASNTFQPKKLINEKKDQPPK